MITLTLAFSTILHLPSILFPLIILAFTIFYALFLFMTASGMKNKAKLLREEVKGKLAILFLEKSVNFLTESEFAELMREVSFITNLKSIDKDNLIDNVYQRSSKIEEELKDLLIKAALVNNLNRLVINLERWSKILKITSILLGVFILLLIFFIFMFPSYALILGYITLGIMLGFFAAIIEALKVYSDSDKYLKLYEHDPLKGE
ncbi:hypothetical protein EWF20_09965 [Sulfolobus sp. S-194]|uniref:hypothetical protein n=1 Tax=Sulfolobus sp. S-194 TaxID=2512240 RepID=UPI0014370B15|nr:hypothetical protein [Sulfolobus sp. S-194]QIW24446.1 hypothetical protein EWF20_09965 [Sulfolobus sp. S-194]